MSEPDVTITGPECAECGRELRWHVLPPGADPSAYGTVEDCPVCTYQWGERAARPAGQPDRCERWRTGRAGGQRRRAAASRAAGSAHSARTPAIMGFVSRLLTSFTALRGTLRRRCPGRHGCSLRGWSVTSSEGERARMPTPTSSFSNLLSPSRSAHFANSWTSCAMTSTGPEAAMKPGSFRWRLTTRWR